MAAVDLSACIEKLSPQVSYLAARGLPSPEEIKAPHTWVARVLGGPR